MEEPYKETLCFCVCNFHRSVQAEGWVPASCSVLKRCLEGIQLYSWIHVIHFKFSCLEEETILAWMR